MKYLRKFKRWMRYNPPESQTLDGWGEFDESFKENAPIRYYLMEEGFHITLRNRIRWFKNRTLDRIHYTFSKPDIIKTGLSRSYHDKSELMLHACFSLLVDYVEKECAHMHVMIDEEKRKELYGWKRFLPRFLRFSKNRNKEYGLNHLEWEINLGEESPIQSKHAKEFLELYTWYTETRPNRKEPPYPEECEHIGLYSIFSDKWQKNYPEEYTAFKNYMDECNRLEIEWQNEDNEMLLRLVKIRESLWT